MKNTTSKSDPLFEAFLQSGFASIQIPIQGSFEKAVLFFLDTGRIWKDSDAVFDSLEGEYTSILENLEILLTYSERASFIQSSFTLPTNIILIILVSS